MCVIVDTNTFASVFKDNSAGKAEFKPVLDWVLLGKGKFIIGGSKYLEELKKDNGALQFLTMLRMRAKDKVYILDRNLVDSLQLRIESRVNDPKFDDPHLPAMVIASHCMIICSLDARSIEFVTLPDLYPKGVKVPRYYMGRRNTDLLCDKYIDRRYKPLSKMRTADVDKLLTAFKERKQEIRSKKR